MESSRSRPRYRTLIRRALWPLAIAGLALPSMPLAVSAQGESAIVEPVTQGGPATLRRLNEGQYRASIADIFGPSITVPGRFDPSLREHGLLAIGDGKVAISSSGFEQYELRARQIAGQIMAEKSRAEYLTCKPVSAQAFDQKCAAAFIGKYGRLLYRRPLTQAETASIIGLSGAAAAKNRNFYKGLEAGLARMLSSPNFIFRVEEGVADRSVPGGRRLDDYSLATRVSFLLWNGPPDAQLLDAAAGGALRAPGGLERQVDRMIASPRFEAGTRAFFSDMFAYDQFDGLTKEQSIFPKYTSALAKDAQEQALRTIVDLLVTNKGDYRDLFTTKKTFINRSLGSLYQVKVDREAVDGWVPYTFADSDPRAGILTLGAFLMLDPSHEGRSSPTIRGKTVRELFMCQEVPLPPNNVDFSAVEDITKEHPTARLRLARHSEDPVCAACHRITDPMGLALEHYDGIGTFRTHENGVPIDTSGELEGKPYKTAMDLVKILRDSPTPASCVVQRAYEYGAGRKVEDGDQAWLTYATRRFADDQYRFPALMRRIATSKAFQVVAAEKAAVRGNKIASAR